jgi:AraC family transcriptional regulator
MLTEKTPSDRIIHDELGWFTLPETSRQSAREVAVSRWAGLAVEPREVTTEIKSDSYVLGISLRPMDLTMFTSEKLFHDGRLPQGAMHISEPGSPIRGIFRGSYDALHVHIGAKMINDLAGETGGATGGKPTLPGTDKFVVDPVVERLAQAMMRADDLDGGFGRQYADGVGLALVARLLARSTERSSSRGDPRVSGLPKWRLKRAIDYIGAHLAEPISLADIAHSTGLTRMHFAAQFRVSTGLRPHEYLLRRRIERAQELLANTRTPLIEVALDVGFSTQAHFTTVFTRFVGETPSVWRRQNYLGPVAVGARRAAA